ncbi:cysteinyl-tRNA synthetase [Cavenderia fasciculata]|uniref:cysteine--tRNA ligase n=1 Tax=Cavenderia fasciculata TaxID=261658 RepID=F4Q4I9_CACFS|nr:cysteinyl-tRNA synthetase [Cavenderia fasciculata]EGG17838.1 cysteinyl-tRNA synthetase [Cavenderia fasciculata]|eukprot:XP_004356322.1 cysteinyl-tRNA synthetase [Cavenderia fasciculata]
MMMLRHGHKLTKHTTALSLLHHHHNNIPSCTSLLDGYHHHHHDQSITKRSHSNCTIHKQQQHGTWRQPTQGHYTGINISNSLNRLGDRKPFPLILESNNLPQHQQQQQDTNNEQKDERRNISWYSCGPTVYDSSHLGHARTYVTIDIIQRIINDYFNYNVIHVMGMTDIDDKIIKKSKETGVSFQELARVKEQEFVDDMASLHVRPPLLITRVTEHIDNIIDFIGKIKENGFAYDVQSDNTNSILFDTKQMGDRYGKFVYNDNIISDDTLKINVDAKRDARDFALWKGTYGNDYDKDGKGTIVSWESPFGKGRPGWHIECSSMIESVFGNKLDIHAGGIDLKFPHHENEIAQCEANFSPTPNTETGEYDQWINYFIHIGHLNIQGLKMSKSLKNFITIREYLKTNTADSLRWICLMNRYYDKIDYNPNNDYSSLPNKFYGWFGLVEQRLKEPLDMNLERSKFTDAKQYIDAFNTTKNEVHQALSQDFNTAKAIRSMGNLVSLTLASPNQLVSSVPQDILSNINDYIRRMFSIFGLTDTMSEKQKKKHQLEASLQSSINTTTTTKTSGDADEPTLKELYDLLQTFRNDVRKIALTIDKPDTQSTISTKQQLLESCDQIRTKLTDMGLNQSDSSITNKSNKK